MKTEKETGMKNEKETDVAADRLASIGILSDKLEELISEALDDRDQFKRYIVVEKGRDSGGESFSENVEKIYRKVDFKSVKEAAGAIKALADAVLTVDPGADTATGINVSFENGEEYAG